MTKRRREHVFAGIVVADTSKEGYQLGVVAIAAHIYLTLFLGIFARTEIVVAKTVVGEILVIGIQTGILCMLL